MKVVYMQTNKTISSIIIGINTLDIVCLIYYAINYVTHNTVVSNPDAMLPAEAWDTAGMALTLGLIPLIVVNSLGFLYVGKQKKIAKLLWFIPSALCLILVVSYWVRG